MARLYVEPPSFAKASAGKQSFLPKQQLPNQEENPQQEYNDGDLVDAVHHFDVDVAGAGRIFFAEKIAAYFSQLEKIFPAFLRLRGGCSLFHTCDHYFMKRWDRSSRRARG